MTDSVPDAPALDPSALSGASFARSRKGFEPAEVRKLLGRAADALRAWQERDERLAARVDELEAALSASRDADEERITEVLGSETARIVAAARSAAAEIRANAEADAARMVAEADEALSAARSAAEQESEALRSEATTLRDEARSEAEHLRAEAADEATRLRSEAQAEHDRLLEAAASVLDERTAEAEVAAAAIRGTAEAELAAARTEGERIRAEAAEAGEAERERAREEGREMVGEARRVRERILRDLAERRRTARQQIEAARAGRNRIMASLADAGAALDAVVEDLAGSERAAEVAGEAAAATVLDDIEQVVTELESGLRTGELSVPQVPAGTGAETDEDTGADTGADAGAEIGDDTGAATAFGEVDVAEIVEVEVVEEPVEATGASVDEAEATIDPGGTDNVVGLAAPRAGGPDAPIDDEPSPGATVHDLFERIRAERGADAGGEPADGTDIVGAGSGGSANGGGEVASAPAASEPPAGSAADAAPGGVAVLQDDTDETRPDDEPVVVALTEPDPTTRLLDRRDQLLEPAEKGLSRTLKRLVSDEQNEVLDRLRRHRKGRVDLAELLPPGPDTVRFVDALTDEFSAAVAAGAELWAELTGAEAPPADGAVAAEVLTARVDELLERRRAHLQRVLDEADEAGLEVAELADPVRAAYREFRSGSVPQLAGDLAAAGFAEGTRRAAPAGTTWCWVADHGGLPCSDAEDNALAGPVPVGEEFPTGDVVPPAHPGCRCLLVPAPR